MTIKLPLRLIALLFAVVFILSVLAVTPVSAASVVDDFAQRCDRYALEHPELTSQQVYIAVTLKLDERNYKNVFYARDPSSLTVFISKHYGISKKYVPEDLVAVDEVYAQKNVTLRADCCSAFLLMAGDMEKEGLTPYIKSGYRRNRKRGGANSLWYAWPGHSEHQTGLAFDLRKKDVTYSNLSAYNYEETAEYAWLLENAYKYGFILSYPDGYSDITGFHFEPWHWRYIGVDIASDMRAKSIATYHEYFALYMDHVQ